MRVILIDTPSIRPCGREQMSGIVRLLMIGACVVLLSLAACDSARPRNELAQLWLDALNSHDPDRVMAMLTSTATYSEPAESLGGQSLRDRLRQTWSLWKDQVYSPKAIIADRDVVVIEWHLQQTHPNGKPVPVDGVTVLEVRDSRIQAVRNYFDMGVYLQLLKPQ
jgi:ketosteroid isomerase-like protein